MPAPSVCNLPEPPCTSPLPLQAVVCKYRAVAFVCGPPGRAGEERGGPLWAQDTAVSENQTPNRMQSSQLAPSSLIRPPAHNHPLSSHLTPLLLRFLLSLPFWLVEVWPWQGHLTSQPASFHKSKSTNWRKTLHTVVWYSHYDLTFWKSTLQGAGVGSNKYIY